MARLSSQAKVGLLVILGIFLLAYMSVRVGNIPFFGKPSGYALKAVFETAAGLENKAQVKVAGVEAGKVEGIELAEGKALVTLRIYPEIKLHKDAQATIRALGLLGEKYVEVTPGSEDQPLLQDGDFIQAETPPADIEQLTGKLGSVVSDIQSVTQTFRKSLGGEKGAETVQRIVDNIDQLTASLKEVVEANRQQVQLTIESISHLSRNLDQLVSENRGAFTHTVNNAAQLSDTLNQIVASNRETLARTLTSLEHLSKTLEQQAPDVTRNMNQALTKVNEVLVENQDNIKEGIASLKQSSKKLDEVLNGVNQVTQKVSRGEGTLGKLINEDEVYQNLNQGLKGLKDFLQKGDQLKTFIGVRSEYLAEIKEAKTYITLKIQPREDKFYLLEVIDDPAGFKTTETTHRTVRDNVTGDITEDITETEEKTEENRLKFSIELAKRFYDFTVRGGLIESSGGLGLDYEPWQSKVKFSLDAWDFGREDAGKNRPHLKLGANVYVWDPVFINLGIDDLLDKDQRTFFLGAGLLFADEDLKGLLTSVPIRVR